MRIEHAMGALACLVPLVACGPSEPAAPPAPPVVASPPAPPAPVREQPATTSDSVARQIAATPPWSVSYEPEPLRPDQQPSTVPQLRDGSRLLDMVPAGPAPREHGLLVCRVSLDRDRHWDPAGLFGANVAPDVSVYVRLAGGAEARARLPEDSYVGVASVPDVAIQEGTSVEVRLVDRDVAVDDSIATLRAPFPAAMPLVLTEGPVTLRCGVVAEEVVEPMATSALAPALRSLAAMERRRPRVDLRAAPYERADADTDEVRRALREAASFVGYTHADVAGALARLVAVERAYASAYRASVERELARVDALGTPLALEAGSHLTFRTTTCTGGVPADAPVRCLLEADAEIARVPDPPGFVSAIQVEWLSTTEQTIHCTATTETDPMHITAPGPAHLVFACMPRTLPADGPVLVRVAQGNIVWLARAR